jgi:Methyltransferase domain
MTQLAQKISQQLYKISPYDNFNHQEYPLDLQGWGSNHPIFAEIIDTINPQLILEVGSWKGASAIHIASLLKAKNIDGAIICIDTWLGGLDNLSHDPIAGISRYHKHGYPTLYYQFLANVIYQEMQDYIIPFPTTSTIGAKYLAKLPIQADLIYLDGSHEEDDVYADLMYYWKLLKPNGVMIGDDWNAGKIWYGVICAVNRFVKENNLNLIIVDDKWLIQKSA